MKKKDKDKGIGRLKVQSMSELAELVKTGQVQVPKSLSHYLTDKVQLLDQVFTILSPDDVKDMIPASLKVGTAMLDILTLDPCVKVGTQRVNDVPP